MDAADLHRAPAPAPHMAKNGVPFSGLEKGTPFFYVTMR